MGLITTLAGHRVTSGRVTIPKWGCWYVDAEVDGEIMLTGAVDMVIADLVLKGTVLSGGPSKGRSAFRVVGGKGGWGKVLPAKSYASDAGVKLATVLGDAANEAGETLEAISPKLQVGAGYTRDEGPASRVLEREAPSAWYVDEAGVTRLGARAKATLGPGVTHGPVDHARGTVTLAADSIKGILPGVVVDGMEVVDVQHEISASTGLRSTVWGASWSGTSRRLAAWRAMFEQFDPDRRFRGLTEYRVATIEGQRLNLQPVRASSGLPNLRRVSIWPGVGGAETTVQLGSRVLVGFVDSDPSRYFVSHFEAAGGAGFVPTSVSLLAGGMLGNEHVMTVEACTVLLHNFAFILANLGLPAAWLVPGAIVGALNGAIAASAVPAPPDLPTQITTAATVGGNMGSTPIVGNTSSPYAFALSVALAGKVANHSGLFPSLGCKAVKAG